MSVCGKWLAVLFACAGAFLATCPRALSQDAIPPISEQLSPSLAENQPTIPATSLSPDLLVPQRTFIYDATGADLFSNSLNPESTARDWSDSATQTDTAIRDSSQAGQLNPYAQGGRRGVQSGTVSAIAAAAVETPSSFARVRSNLEPNTVDR